MARIVFDSGEAVELSRETEERLKKELLKPKGFEQLIDDFNYIRVSSKDKDGSGDYPLRISILEDYRRGLPLGEYSANNCGTLSGETLSIHQAKQLIEVLQNCIKYINKHQN